MFGFFRRKDPVCGMKEDKSRGVVKDGNWFCSNKCLKSHKIEKPNCCGSHEG